MKILVVADWHGEIYAEAIMDGFSSLGHTVSRFSWKEYFRHYQYENNYKVNRSIIKSFYYRLQNKLILGPSIWKINSDLINQCQKTTPDMVFIYRGTHIYPKTIALIKRNSNCKVFGYNNDDPFSSEYRNYIWRYFKKSIPLYDWIFSYRNKNLDDYKTMGFEHTSLLRSYYLKANNFQIQNLISGKYKCDVIFVGHFENDGRDKIIKFLIDNGIDIRLYGAGWKNSIYYDFFSKELGVIKPLYDDYNLALNSAKIALVFLSKLNHDSYTRRCFEIPATKTMMISEYTDDLNSMFNEGVSAEYFRNKYELINKILLYLSNIESINKVGEQGYKTLVKGGNEVTDRCLEILKVYDEI